MLCKCKITSKGQITIPAKFRKKLSTNLVEVYMEDNKIVLKPIRKLAGVLSKCALKGMSMEEIARIFDEALSGKVKVEVLQAVLAEVVRGG